MKANNIRTRLLLSIDTEIKQLINNKSSCKINGRSPGDLSKQFDSPSIAFTNPMTSNSIISSTSLIRLSAKVLNKGKTMNNNKKKPSMNNSLQDFYNRQKCIRKQNIALKSTRKISTGSQQMQISPIVEYCFKSPSAVILIESHTIVDSYNYLKNLSKDIKDEYMEAFTLESSNCQTEDDYQEFEMIYKEEIDFSTLNRSMTNVDRVKRKKRKEQKKRKKSWDHDDKKKEKNSQWNETSSECSSGNGEFSMKLYAMDMENDK